MKTYSIPQPNMEYLEEKLTKLARKAARLDVGKISWRVVGQSTKLTPSTQFNLTSGGMVEVDYFEIEVIGDTPTIDGWMYVATLQHTPDGVIIRSNPDNDFDISEYYKENVSKCDHCNVNRYRNDTYVVCNIKSGDYKQVGSSCLKDFTGYNGNPHDIVSFYESMNLIADELDNASEFDYEGHNPEQYNLPLIDLVSSACASIRVDGWVSSTVAYDQSLISTSTLIKNSICAKQKSDKIAVSPGDIAKAEKVIKFIRKRLGNENTTLNDYTSNLNVSFSGDYVSFRQIGIVASGVSYYDREQSKYDGLPESNWVHYPINPNKKKRRHEFELTHIMTHTLPDYGYGVSYINLFRDDDGNDIVWKTGKDFSQYETNSFEGKATVKEHKTYNGRKQTVVTRGKLECVIVDEVDDESTMFCINCFYRMSVIKWGTANGTCPDCGEYNDL